MIRSLAIILLALSLGVATLLVLDEPAQGPLAISEVTSASGKPSSRESAPRESLGVTLVQETSSTAGEVARTALDASEIGPQLSIQVSTSGAPGIRVLVGASVPNHEITRIFGSVVTDSLGMGTLTVPWDMVESARDLPAVRLRAQVEQPGQRATMADMALPESAEDTPSLSLRLKSGLTLRGQLFGANGEPAAGLISLYLGRADGSLRAANRTRAREDGRFWMHVNQGGEGLLFGQATSADYEGGLAPWFNQHDLGTGKSEPFAYEIGKPFEPVEIHATGKGEITGRILDGGGGPAPGLPLLLERVVQSPDQTLDGGGVHMAKIISDRLGYFTFRGLREGSYTIHAKPMDESSQGNGVYDVLLTPSPVWVGCEPLALSLARPRIAVILRNPDGTLFGGNQSLDLQEFESLQLGNGGIGRRGLLDVDVVQVYGAPQESGVYPRQFEPRRVGESMLVYDVECGMTYEVGLVGTLYRWEPRVVHVPDRGGFVTVELIVEAPKAPGYLEVTVVDNNGLPHDGRVYGVLRRGSDGPEVQSVNLG